MNATINNESTTADLSPWNVLQPRPSGALTYFTDNFFQKGILILGTNLSFDVSSVIFLILKPPNNRQWFVVHYMNIQMRSLP